MFVRVCVCIYIYIYIYMRVCMCVIRLKTNVEFLFLSLVNCCNDNATYSILTYLYIYIKNVATNFLHTYSSSIKDVI